MYAPRDSSRRLYRPINMRGSTPDLIVLRAPKSMRLPWTVGDHDRAAFMHKNPRLTVQQVSDRLALTGLAATIEELEEIKAAGL